MKYLLNSYDYYNLSKGQAGRRGASYFKKIREVNDIASLVNTFSTKFNNTSFKL